MTIDNALPNPIQQRAEIDGAGARRLAVIHGATDSADPVSLSPIRVRSLRELRQMPEAETSWVVYRFLATTAITDLSAYIKAGKSTLSAQLITAICHGTEFLEEFPTDKGAVVLLTEEPPATLLEAFADAGLTDTDPLHVMLWAENDMVPWDQAVMSATDFCAKVGARTLIVDTLSQWAKVENENDASQAHKAMGPLLRAAGQGLAVLTIRQSRKTGGEIHNAGRGSGAFAGAASILLHLDYTNNDTQTTRKLTIKSRLEREQPFPMNLDYSEGRYRLVDGKATRGSIVDRILTELQLHPGTRSKDLCERLDIKRGSLSPNLMRLRSKGLIRSENGCHELTGAGQTSLGYTVDTLDTSARMDTGVPPYRGNTPDVFSPPELGYATEHSSAD